MFSKREMESYVEIDHRESPGITPEQAARAGRGTIPVGKGQVFKSAAYQCSNCERLVVLNPNRSRDRFWCSKCDEYHCDDCALRTKITGICRPFKQLIEEALTATVKQAKLILPEGWQ